MKRWLRVGGPSLLVAAAVMTPWVVSHASDHIDFPGNETSPSGTTSDADITDVFAFTSPGGLGRLVLVMNTLNDAGADATFSDALEYTFRVRPAARADDGRFRAGEEDSRELAIRCRYTDGEPGEMTCRTEVTCGEEGCTEGASYENRVQIDAADGGSTEGDALGCDEKDCALASDALQVFAGLRADPFFIDGGAAAATLLPPGPRRDALRQMLGIQDLETTLVMPGPHPRNSLAGKNVLSLVVELDVETVFGSSLSTLAVVGETYRLSGGEP